MRELGESKRADSRGASADQDLKYCLKNAARTASCAGYSRNYMRVSAAGPRRTGKPTKLRWRRRLSRASNWLGRLFGRGRSGSARRRRPPESRGTELEARLGYTFARPELLRDGADPSERRGRRATPHYERLEFLGDAVLDLAIADLLMRTISEAKEGLAVQGARLDRQRPHAGAKAQAIGLNRMLRLGKGEEKSGGREKVSILAAAFEAVIGAIYTDGGLRAGAAGGRAPVRRRYRRPSRRARLQDRIAGGRLPPFSQRSRCTNWSRPTAPITRKRFTTRIRIAGRELGVGEGGSKKQSEQAAARAALDRIERENAVSAMGEHRAGFVALGGPHQRRQIDAAQPAGRAQGRDRHAASADHAPANPRHPHATPTRRFC